MPQQKLQDLGRGGFSPVEIAKAYRDEHPRMFDDLSDGELMQAIEQADPETFKLVDPLLIGSELLPHYATGTPPPSGPLPTPPVPTSTFDTLMESGLRIVPAVVGAAGGTYLGGPGPGTYAGGAAGAGIGETAAQYYEKHYGNRQDYSPGTIALSAGLGALNPAARGESLLARTAYQTVFGGALGAGGATGRSLIEQGQFPSASDVALSTAEGAAFGGATHLGFEAVHAAGQRVPGFADVTGALPTDIGPPPAPVDLLPGAIAAHQQYEAEEARLAAGLHAVYGPDASAGRRSDFHTAMQAKSYLEELAALNKPPVPVPPIQPGLTESPYAPPPDQPLLPPGRGDPNAFRAYPPGENPPIELVGSGAPPANRIIGGTDASAGSGPPPTLQDIVGQTTAGTAEVGPPRLVPRPLELTPTTPGVPRGMAEAEQPPLMRRPTLSQRGPIEQGGTMGGQPATREQPRLPGTDQPHPLDRTYATGPNAGPRRKNEPHNVPRMVRRRVDVGKTFRFEQVPSKTPAVDPATWHPEARREVARMLAELQDYPHEQIQGGINGRQIEQVKDALGVSVDQAIGHLKRSGASSGGAIAGAPVYHDILGLAEGFKHATRADVIKALREALFDGKGSLLSDAALQVAGHRNDFEIREATDPQGATRANLVRYGPANQYSRVRYKPIGPGDRGDELIGWVDEAGRQTLPAQDLTEFQREAREETDGGILAAMRMEREGDINPEVQGYFDAVRHEAVRRGLIEPEQLALTMEGPGGAKGPSILQFNPDGTLRSTPRTPNGHRNYHSELEVREKAGGVLNEIEQQQLATYRKRAPKPPAPAPPAVSEVSEEPPPPPSGRAAKDLAAGRDVRKLVGAPPPGITERRHAELMRKFAGGSEAERRAAYPTAEELQAPAAPPGPPPLVPRSPNLKEPFGPTATAETPPALQAKTRVRKGPDFTNDRTWEVTFPNGKTTGIFYDQGSQTWYENLPTTKQYTSHYSDDWAFSKQELLDKLEQKYATPAEAATPTASLAVTPTTHLDHGLTDAHLSWIQEHYAGREGFFIDTVELPDSLPPIQSGLHGPLVGDAPVSDTEAFSQVRGERGWPSRLVDRPTRETRTLTVIAGPVDGKMTLYTAFGGPLAPQEPGDPGVRDLGASTTFWQAHALSGTRLEAGPPPGPPSAAQVQPELPGTEGVRAQEIPTPEVADLPFALSPPPAKPERFGERTPAPLLRRLLDEEGVLILDVPSGDRVGLRKWLKKQEDEHGGSPWFARVEHHMEDGEWDKAWKTAAAASVKSYSKAFTDAKTPQQEALLTRAIRGTPLQNDINTEIIAGARQRSGLGTAPRVTDFPPSQQVSQAGAARGKATIGPAGIINPGPIQKPLRPAERAHTLPRTFVETIINETDPALIHLVPGNRDTNLRIYRQVMDLAFAGTNTRELKQYLKLSDQEIGQHGVEAVQEAARLLQSLSALRQANEETMTEAAEAISMGGMLNGMSGQGRVIVGKRGQVIGTTGSTMDAQATLDRLTEDTGSFDQAMLAHALQAPRKSSELELAQAASYPFMLMRWRTAVRNAMSTAGRYTVDALDEALTIPFAKLMGDDAGAAYAKARAIEMTKIHGKWSALVTPRTSWKATLQDMYDFGESTIGQLEPSDARRTLALLSKVPAHEAHFLGAMAGGEQFAEGGSRFAALNAILDPKLQRILTVFNRAQEFSTRGIVFDATTRAQLRAKGLNPDVELQKPYDALVSAVGGAQAMDNLLHNSTTASLEAAFSGQAAKQSIPGALLQAVNKMWPLKLGYPFPKFNIVAAPRWIYDHTPAALMELLRFPLDTVGLTSGEYKGGRLYRGVRGRVIQQRALPELAGKRQEAVGRLGTARKELIATRRELGMQTRLVGRLERRAQAGLPDIETPLEQARARQDQLARRQGTIQESVSAEQLRIRKLQAQEDKLLDIVKDAQGINAPTLPQYLARMTTGTALLGAAAVIRAQTAAEGTRWYEFKYDKGDGSDPDILDFRPYAPFAQYLYVADVMQDITRFTDWAKAHAQAATDGWTAATWDNYEGKYTREELGAQFAQAFLSISRAGGTTLTLTDLMTQNGWPSPQDATDALVGTVGQFLSRFYTGFGDIKDLAAGFSEEEAKVRIPPRATTEEWTRPLAAPLSQVPGVSRLIPERISQTTGKAVTTTHPWLRALAGIGSAPRDFITEEVRKVGVPGQSVFIRETGDYGLDKLVAETYAGILQQELPSILEDAQYQALETPARKRDFLQRSVFPPLKRAALGETRSLLGEERFTSATVQGEASRRRQRQQKLLDALTEETPPVAPEQQEGLAGTAPPGPPGAGGGTLGAPPPGPPPGP